MSLEARVTSLENKFETLDDAVRNLIKITGETHQILLENQRENRIRFDQQDCRMDRLESAIATLAEATHAGFKRVDERLEQHDQRFDQVDKRFDLIDQRFGQVDKRFDQLELLIRQSRPTN